MTVAVLGAAATSVLLTSLVSGALADATGAVTALTVLAAAELVDASVEASGFNAAATGVVAVAAASAAFVEVWLSEPVAAVTVFATAAAV